MKTASNIKFDSQISYQVHFLRIMHRIWSNQVECQSVAEALEAAGAGADIVMLDNFTHDTIGAAAAEVKAVFPHILVEASGVSQSYFK